MVRVYAGGLRWYCLSFSLNLVGAGEIERLLEMFNVDVVKFALSKVPLTGVR